MLMVLLVVTCEATLESCTMLSASTVCSVTLVFSERFSDNEPSEQVGYGLGQADD